MISKRLRKGISAIFVRMDDLKKRERAAKSSKARTHHRKNGGRERTITEEATKTPGLPMPRFTPKSTFFSFGANVEQTPPKKNRKDVGGP